ncbi:MAG: AarF/ABC1/UbiB kinase family protein [Gemmatimonadetes bacterium]|nr:AarF/ABC1/UbiB kinase family protein [Gemmatimonadota bacterium]
MKRVARGSRIFFALLPFIFASLRDRQRFILLGRPARRGEGHHERRARQLTETIASLGPTFIKLAQIFSARTDLVPEPYISSIGTLQDQVPPVPWDDARRVIEGELGGPVGEFFEVFDPTPMAAASLGQVHRARHQGREVAVKILRPLVEETVALDLDLSFRILFWLNILFPNHHVRGITNVVREFSVRVREEMNFLIEAENMRHAGKLFASLEGVRAPEVVEGLTTRRVLVMEYLEGTKVDALHARFQSGELRFDDVMERLTGVYLRMMMTDGFMHADPHPGNLMVAEDGSLVVLDWGMVLNVPRWTRDAILSVALAIEQEDLDGMISGMYRLGMISLEVSRSEIREAATEIMRIMDRARGSSLERIQEIVQELLDTFYTWPILLPQELVYFFRAAVLLEGIGFRYRPDFNGIHLVRKVIRVTRAEFVKDVTQAPLTAVRDLFGEVTQMLRSVRELLQRTERDELRVRVHPRDAQAQERIVHLQARRLLLSIFATATAVISSIIFLALRNVWLLGLGLGVALVMFVLTLLIPTHLLENPLRHARGIRPR